VNVVVYVLQQAHRFEIPDFLNLGLPFDNLVLEASSDRNSLNLRGMYAGDDFLSPDGRLIVQGTGAPGK
jgi:hypothetical protein